jgi:hypothetical protein
MLQHFERHGLRAFSPVEVRAILERLLSADVRCAGAGDVDWRKWARAFNADLSALRRNLADEELA